MRSSGWFWVDTIIENGWFCLTPCGRFSDDAMICFYLTSPAKLPELENRSAPFTFADLSELLLGQRQPNQFQSSSDEQPTHWTWGSIYNESGDTVGTDSSCSNKSSGNISVSYVANFGKCVENNSRTEIPRSYNEEYIRVYGNFYNWYAATAESGNWDNTDYDSDGNARDSLCPAGWSLPVSSNASGVRS